MKNFRKTIVLGAAVWCAMTVQAEVLDTVYYNPSRLGRYKTLKVTDTVTARGGVSVGENMMLDNAGVITVSGASDGYSFENIASAGEVDFSGMSVNTAALGAGMSGALGYFSQGGVSSLINTLAANALIKAKTLNISSSSNFSITGVAAERYDGSTAAGFTLGRNTIPVAEITQNLVWISRKDDSGNTWKLLGMEATAANTCQGSFSRSCGCNLTGTQTRTCTAGSWSAWGPCSVSDCEGCENETYKEEHLSECCPLQPYSDSDCYESLGWYAIGAYMSNYGGEPGTYWQCSDGTIIQNPSGTLQMNYPCGLATVGIQCTHSSDRFTTWTCGYAPKWDMGPHVGPISGF